MRPYWAVGLALLACDGSATREPLAPDFAATVTHFKISAPIGIQVVNPCTGSDVVGSVQVSTTSTSVLDPGGNQRSTETFRARGTGTDADGTVYSLREVRALTEHVSAEALVTGFTLVQMINVVSHGGHNNFLIRALIRSQLNAGGDLVASIDRIDALCRN